MTNKTLKLGEHSWEIPQLPFRALIEIEPLINAQTTIPKMIDIALVGIKHADQSVTREQLLDMHIPLQDLKSAVDIVATQCGLEFNTKKGEA